MQKSFVCLMMASVGLALPASGYGEAHKTGLWEVTTKTVIQQSGDVEGRLNGNQPGGSGSMGSLPVCYSSDLINHYGIALPPSLRDCELSNVIDKPDSFRADLSCKGTYNGKGSVETTWTDEDHVTGKVHFTSKTRDAQPMMIRWNQDLTAVFKSADCGNVKPRVIPQRPVRPAPAR